MAQNMPLPIKEATIVSKRNNGKNDGTNNARTSYPYLKGEVMTKKIVHLDNVVVVDNRLKAHGFSIKKAGTAGISMASGGALVGTTIGGFIGGIIGAFAFGALGIIWGGDNFNPRKRQNGKAS